MQLPINSTLQNGKFRVMRHLASGGFGNTYEVEHTMLHKCMALKEFFPSSYCVRDSRTNRVTIITEARSALVARLKQKFIDEAVAISGFDHPGIVRVSDVFEENCTAYYVMDFIDGESLEAMVRRLRRLPEDLALKYFF